MTSTGPRTPEGKAISSKNAFQHGLCATTFLIQTWENAADYDALLDGFRSEHQPQTPTESLLVEQLAQHWWLSQRALRLQELCFDSTIPMLSPAEERSFALYVRYGTTHERAFHKTFTTLKQLQKERKKEPQFVSQAQPQPNPTAEHQPAANRAVSVSELPPPSSAAPSTTRPILLPTWEEFISQNRSLRPKPNPKHEAA